MSCARLPSLSLLRSISNTLPSTTTAFSRLASVATARRGLCRCRRRVLLGQKHHAPRPEEGDGACRHDELPISGAKTVQNGRLFILTLGQKLCRPPRPAGQDSARWNKIVDRTASLGQLPEFRSSLPNDRLLYIRIILFYHTLPALKSAHPRDGGAAAETGSASLSIQRYLPLRVRQSVYRIFSGLAIEASSHWPGWLRRPDGTAEGDEPLPADTHPQNAPAGCGKVPSPPRRRKHGGWYSWPEQQPRYAFGPSIRQGSSGRIRRSTRSSTVLTPRFSSWLSTAAGWCRCPGRGRRPFPLGNNDSG